MVVGGGEVRVLAVDMDGTLIRTDVMQEAVVAFVAQNPLNVVRLLAWWTRGRAFLKEQLAAHAPPVVPGELPYNEEFLDYLKAQKAQGRPLVLATAAHRVPAEAVAAHLGIFDSVLATENGHNLIGENKARRLVAEYGEGGFGYAGDSRKDVPVWARAGEVIMVNPSTRVSARVRAQFAKAGADARVFETPAVGVWRRALRLHHWLKNLLIFVALIGGHKVLSAEAVAASVLAFLIFGLLASATYLINDVFDAAHDRRHERKRRRPVAAGELSIFAALGAAAGLVAAALGLSVILLPPAFVGVALLYIVATLAYSLVLKRMLLLDVLMLSLLFTVRILAGGAATGIELSFWLLAFSVFIFLSLALLKRYLELAGASGENLSGRGYRTGDTAVVMNLGITAGMISVFILALYINSDAVRARYADPEIIWMAVPLMIYWVSRVWVLGVRREVADDPLMFAVRDKMSWGVGALFLLLAYLAV